MNKSKTDQTLQAIREKAQQIGYGEWSVKLLVHKGELVGFEQEKPPLIKFRAQDSPRKKGMEDAI